MYLVRSFQGALRAPVKGRDQIRAAKATTEAAAIAAAAPAAAASVSNFI